MYDSVFTSAHYSFFGIFRWFKQNDITLWTKQCRQQPKTRSENGKYLYSICIFSRGVDISWDKGYPNSAEDKHAEGDKLGLIEVIW